MLCRASVHYKPWPSHTRTHARRHAQETNERTNCASAEQCDIHDTSQHSVQRPINAHTVGGERMVVPCALVCVAGCSVTFHWHGRHNDIWCVCVCDGHTHSPSLASAVCLVCVSACHHPPSHRRTATRSFGEQTNRRTRSLFGWRWGDKTVRT